MDHSTDTLVSRLVAEYDGVLPASTVRACVAAATPRMIDLDAPTPRELDLEAAAREDLEELRAAVDRRSALVAAE